MSFSNPLRAELFKYRKRKRLSLDGATGGIPATDRTPASMKDPALALDLPHQQHDYDPIHAAYQNMAQEYEQQASWFEGFHPRPTPDLRLDPISGPGAGPGAHIFDMDELHHEQAALQPAGGLVPEIDIKKTAAEVTQKFLELYHRDAQFHDPLAEINDAMTDAKQHSAMAAPLPDYDDSMVAATVMPHDPVIDAVAQIDEPSVVTPEQLTAQFTESAISPSHDVSLEAILLEDERVQHQSDAIGSLESIVDPLQAMEDELLRQQRLYEQQFQQGFDPGPSSIFPTDPFGLNPLMGPG